ncbi:MAG: DMT family transporter [Saprospiraceae bacterium]|nr:DMT family transporter [Saprospiraceae bacterium]
MNHHFYSHLALFVVALIYGANYSIAKLLLDPGFIGPNAFVFFRVLFAALIFLCITRCLFIYEKKDILLLFICGFSGIIGNQLLFFNGLKNTSPVHAALLMVCTPILVLLIKFLQGQSLSKKQWLGCLIGLTGAVYIVLARANVQHTKSGILGDLMVFANALLYGYYLVKVPALITKYGAFHVMTALFSISVLPVSALAYHELDHIQFTSFGNEEWFTFSFVLIATTFGAYALNAYALKHSDPSLVSVYIYLQPLIGTLIALITGKDKWNWAYLVSGLLIFTGLFLSNKKNLAFSKKFQQAN